MVLSADRIEPSLLLSGERHLPVLVAFFALACLDVAAHGFASVVSHSDPSRNQSETPGVPASHRALLGNFYPAAAYLDLCIGCCPQQRVPSRSPSGVFARVMDRLDRAVALVSYVI